MLQGWDSGTATPAANTGVGVKFGKSETSSGMVLLLLQSFSMALWTGRVLCGTFYFYFIFMCHIYFGLSGQGATQSRPLSAHIILIFMFFECLKCHVQTRDWHEISVYDFSMDKTETILFYLILNCNSVIDIRCRRDSHHLDYSAPVNTLVGFIVHSVYIFLFSLLRLLSVLCSSSSR